jgi:hypothetical protein
MAARQDFKLGHYPLLGRPAAKSGMTGHSAFLFSTAAETRHLRGMTALRNLVLDETRITDAALDDAASDDVGQLTNLEEWLGLTHTQVTDTGLPSLARLRKLKILNLIRTKISREAQDELRITLPETDISPY